MHLMKIYKRILLHTVVVIEVIICKNITLSSYSLILVIQAGGYTYVFSLCGNVPQAMIPKECSSLEFGTTVAYQYSSTGCQALGKLETSFVVSLKMLVLLFVMKVS